MYKNIFIKAMNLEPINANYFMNIPNGAFFEFDADKEELQIKETDNIYFLRKEKK